MDELKPCPFCGGEAEFDGLVGTQIGISCCASMGFQKSDYMTMEERQTWNPKTYKYSDEAEAKVRAIAIKYWNKRNPNPQ